MDEFDDGLSDSVFRELALHLEQVSPEKTDAGEPVSLAVGLDYAAEEELSLLSRDDILELERQRAEIRSSPYERFRSRRGHLSVTDIVSPSWCESQFQYSLEKGGRKRQTKAMSAGEKIHGELESEVHKVVPFNIDRTVKEEILGLSLLNMLCGLLELDHGRITRELPVFGKIHGVFVLGVIDELKYVATGIERRQETISMEKFLNLDLPRSSDRLIISDAKSRVHYSEPSVTQLNQSKHQLMLYLQLLKTLHCFDMSQYLQEANLDGRRSFSDTFLAQTISLLDDQAEQPDVDAFSCNSINDLWALLRPRLASLETQLSDECCVTYIHQGSLRLIAERSFHFDATWMEARNKKVFDWWHGSRAADGVPIEEAYKCRLCEMEPGCSFRLKKLEDEAENRLRKQKRR